MQDNLIYDIAVSYHQELQRQAERQRQLKRLRPTAQTSEPEKRNSGLLNTLLRALTPRGGVQP